MSTLYGSTASTADVSTSVDVADFRSDTLTSPDAAMRRVMAEAPVGDDVFVEDPTVLALEAHVAALLEKERALFVPSGTMSNLIAAIVHGAGLHSEIIMGDAAHTVLHEGGGAAAFGGVHPRQLVTQPDGTIALEDLAQAIQNSKDVHVCDTKAIFLENTHNKKGGKVLPMEYLASVRALCDQHGLQLHCDGARLWNASIALGVSPAEVARPFDTLAVCCSKGLGAPAGSLIVGPAAFIQSARRVRKSLGGGMRQVGIIAAGALYGVQHMYARLAEDHAMAKTLAEGIAGAGFEVIPPQSNIVLWDVGAARRPAFLEHCASNGVRLVGMGAGAVRAIPHYGNTTGDIQKALAVIRGFVSKS